MRKESKKAVMKPGRWILIDTTKKHGPFAIASPIILNYIYGLLKDREKWE